MSTEETSPLVSILSSSLVVLGNIPALASCGIFGDVTANNCPSVEVFFSITVGYFLFDFAVVLYYKMAFWQVFVVHHTCAISPYFISNFIPGCSNAQYLLGIFIQVEIATLVLNYQNLLELSEQTNTLKYRVTFYSAYVLWFLVRIILPYYIFIVMMKDVRPCYGTTWYAVIGYFCAAFVVFFCTYVFVLVMTPDVMAHLRGPPADPNSDQFTSVDAADESGNMSIEMNDQRKRGFTVERAALNSDSARIHFRSRGSSMAIA